MPPERNRGRWRTLYSEEVPRQRLLTDNAAAEYPTNRIVRNLPAFQDAFYARPGDALYVPADEQVSIW